MIEQTLRPLAQRLFFSPLAALLAPHISPNQMTLLSCILGICVIPAYYYFGAWCGTLALLLSGIADVLDGSIARKRGESSPVGGIYDILSDRVVESAAIIALYVAIPDSGIICLFMLSSILLCITSFLLSGIHTPKDGKKSFYYSPGFMERAEAFTFFIAIMWLPNWFIGLGLLFTALVLWTTYVRMKELISQLNSDL